MNRPDNKQARKWANEIAESRQTNIRPDAFAAAELIQSLPETIVDGEEIQKWYDQVEGLLPYWAREDFKSLIAPKLPTLAELIEDGNDPQKYQWMQCTVEGRGDDTFVIVMVREDVTKVLHPDGMHEVKRNSQVFPMLDEPKLKWPGSRADTNTAESEEDVLAGLVGDFEPALPRPEDVPPGEAWLIKFQDKEMESIKTWDPRHPWTVSDKKFVKYGRDAYADQGVTLISRLVPKPR